MTRVHYTNINWKKPDMKVADSFIRHLVMGRLRVASLHVWLQSVKWKFAIVAKNESSRDVFIEFEKSADALMFESIMRGVD
jgi:hypothetical protein